MNEDSINYLSLTICMRVERRGKFKVTVKECPKGVLECVKKTGIPIRYYALAKSKMWPDMLKKQFGGLYGRGGFITQNKEGHFRKMTNDYPNGIMSTLVWGQNTKVIHRNRFPWFGRYGVGLIEVMFPIFWFTLRT